ncbi:MAG: BlaI/MecI/CopY family transcriptional regulator [Bacteroidia bacterium]|nr:BlaI/MecI/CopY family transcriptional regulator [Bacteroidia bacterium]
MQKLTKAEEEVMSVVWRLGKGFLKDILDATPDPKPASSTIATVIRILEGKGFLAHHAYGRNFEYYPLISKDDYLRGFLKQVIASHFDGSLHGLIQFFHRSGDLNLRELNELLGDDSPQPPDSQPQ